MPRRQGSQSPRKARKREFDSSVIESKLQERDRLIDEYHKFVDVVVSRLARSMGLPQALREDFVSAGFLGLIEAASRFDASRGQDFRGYAFLRIRGAVIDHIRKSCDLSGRAYRVLRALEAAHEMRESRFEQRVPEQISKRERSEHAIRELERSGIIRTLADAALPDTEPRQPDHHNPEVVLECKRRAQKIRTIVATLPAKERTIIEQYYFHDRKMIDVAEQFSGLSKSWVSRLHDRALDMLRDKLRASLVDMAA
jgi:RNA polymerase sigma factor for flagellar operon FliA